MSCVVLGALKQENLTSITLERRKQLGDSVVVYGWINGLTEGDVDNVLIQRRDAGAGSNGYRLHKSTLK